MCSAQDAMLPLPCILPTQKHTSDKYAFADMCRIILSRLKLLFLGPEEVNYSAKRMQH
jgi:hypothetical protein